MVTAGTEDNMIRQSYKITALYCRIDHGSRSAMSAVYAQNQQKRLVYYAKEQRLHNLQIFCDRGYSGCNIDRPEYQKMLAAIRADQVSDVVVMDLSRLIETVRISANCCWSWRNTMLYFTAFWSSSPVPSFPCSARF